MQNWTKLDNGNTRLQLDGYNLIYGPIRDDNFSYQGVIKDGAGKMLVMIKTSREPIMQTMLLNFLKETS